MLSIKALIVQYIFFINCCTFYKCRIRTYTKKNTVNSGDLIREFFSENDLNLAIKRAKAQEKETTTKQDTELGFLTRP